MNSDIFIIHAGTALHSWLNYISSVQREYILAENSIKYPVSEYLGTQVDLGKIYLDREHPDLNDRYLDLRFCKNFENIEFECAIEFKFSRIDYTEQTKEKRRIFHDIMRLKMFVENKANRKGYFLICGSQLNFIKSFQSIGWNDSDKINNNGLPSEKPSTTFDYSKIEPKGTYTNWFKFNKDEKLEIDISSTDSALEPIYSNFFDEYDKNFKSGTTKSTIKQRNPISRLVYISESSNLVDIPTPMKVGIWEITAKS